MHNQIDLRLPVATLIQAHPELKELLIELGFKPLANPLMLNTVGKTTNLITGAKLIKIPLDTIIRQLKFSGYDIIGDDQHDE